MITRQLASSVILCSGFALFLVTLNSLLPVQTSAYIFSERGPFEILSFILWFILAVVVLLVVRPRNPTSLALAVLAVVAGFRELGANSALTSESITRISFYLNPEIFWVERLAVVGFVVFLCGTAAILLVKLGRWLIARKGYAQPAGQVVLLAILLVPMTKLLDRMPAYLRGFLDIEPSLAVVGMMTALEEGLEMLLPILFLQALFLLPRAARDRQNTGAQLHRV